MDLVTFLLSCLSVFGGVNSGTPSADVQKHLEKQPHKIELGWTSHGAFYLLNRTMNHTEALTACETINEVGSYNGSIMWNWNDLNTKNEVIDVHTTVEDGALWKTLGEYFVIVERLVSAFKDIGVDPRTPFFSSPTNPLLRNRVHVVSEKWVHNGKPMLQYYYTLVQNTSSPEIIADGGKEQAVVGKESDAFAVCVIKFKRHCLRK